MYEGTWNASTNTPTIVSSVGSKGDYYIVATAGSTNINGITSWNIGDWIIFNGTTWDKVDNTDAVSSVNGYTGAVSLVTNDIAESTNLYFTNARAIGSTLTGYTSGSGVVAATDTILQAIQKLNGNVSGLVTGVSSVFGRTGAVVATSGDYTTTQVTEGTNLYYTATRFNTAFSSKTTTDLTEGTNLYYTEGRVSANTDVAANTAARHAAVTIGTANGLSLSTQALSLAAASTSATGALTSTDWNTFNNKLSTATAASTYVPYTGATGNVTLGTNSFTAGVGSFASSGGSDTFAINHSSGSGIALNITKGGNGEGLYINKTSGSGNAATIIGTLNATTLVKSGGTSSQFLKADGSVDSSTYLTTSAASSTYLPLSGGTLTGALSGTSATFSGDVTSGGQSQNLFIANGNTFSGFKLSRGGVQKWSIFNNNAGTDFFDIYNYNTNSSSFTIASTGDATFSSSVQTSTFFRSNTSTTNSITIGVSANANYGYIGNSNYWGIRTGTSGDFNIDVNNSSSPINAFKIAQGGNLATFSSSVSAGDSVSLLGELYWGGFSSGQKVRAYPTGSSGSATLNFAFWDGSTWGIQATLTSAGVWSSNGGGTSDARTKDEIDYNFDNGIESILKLQPTKFKFKIAPNKQRRGFIAQDVLTTIPDLVLGDGEKENGTYGLDYDGILALAVKAIQELKAEIDELKNK
jgi:hypothetical protein